MSGVWQKHAQHRKHGVHQHDDLHQIVVLIFDGCGEQTARAGNGIQAFDHQRAGNDKQQIAGQIDDQRNNRISENVLFPDLLLGKALHQRKFDIILVFLIHHKAAQPQCIVGNTAQRQTDGGQYPRFRPVAIVNQRQIKQLGDPHLNKEQIDNRRHGANQQNIKGTQLVAPAIFEPDHQQTEQQTKCDAQHHTGKAKGCRHGDFLFQQGCDGNLGINRQASSQIALEQVFDETP